MSAYVIVDIAVTNASLYEEYKRLAQVSVQASGGRYIARGGTTQLLEGSSQPNRVVVLEFPSLEHARAWYASPEYSRAIAVRQPCAKVNMVLVDGL